MVHSMTGYGRGEAAYTDGRFVVEMKAVNHRFCEVAVRMPRQLGSLEDRLKKEVQRQVARGRIDIYVNWEESGSRRRSLKVDKELAIAYHNALKELGDAIGSKQEISSEMIAKLPDVIVIEEEALEVDALWQPLQQAVQMAGAALVQMRLCEGEALVADVSERLRRLSKLAATIAERAPVVVDEYRARLERRLQELLHPGTVDPARLATEVAIFAERADISEELQRLSSHLEQAHAALAAGGPVGRKLDFLVQEMGREVNTVGAKASDLAIGQAVVEAKSELEKIREQVQNIE